MIAPPFRFFVHGTPRPQGSKRGFAIKKGGTYTGKVALVESSPRIDVWRGDVRTAALGARDWAHSIGRPDTIKQGRAVAVDVIFYMPRPKSHHRTGRNAHLLRDSAPKHPTGKPDVDKLARAVLDACTGILWHDDSQVITQRASKAYADGGQPAGAEIRITDVSDAS